MNYKDIRLYTPEKILLALSNDFPKVYQLEDAIEDSDSPQELTTKLKSEVENYMDQITLDRTTDKYIRYKLVDRCKNVELLYIYLEQEGYPHERKKDPN